MPEEESPADQSPAAVEIELSEGTAHTVTVAISGTDLVVTVDGVITSRPLAEISSLTVTGGNGDDTFSIDASVVAALGFPVLFDSSAGTLAPGETETAVAPSGAATTSSSGTTSQTLSVSVSEWTVTAADGFDHQIAVSFVDGNLSVTLDGVTTTQAASSVLKLTIVGGNQRDALQISTSLVPAGVPILFDGREGVDSIRGPPSDTTWFVTAASAGTVAGVDFANVEELVGAPDTEDTFTVEAGGSISSVDGGDRGFDTLVVAGGGANVVSTITGPQSGTIARDNDVLSYSGLEPITTSGNEITIVGTSAGDTFTISDDATAGQFLVSCSCGETHTITSASTVTKLTINAGDGADSITFTSIDSAFAGELILNGQGGSDTLSVGDTSGAWHITAVDAGSYKPATGAGASFTGIENLVGAATAADAFEFDSGAGLSGTINDGAGTLTVSAVGFVKISGDDLDFAQQTHSVTPSNGSAVTANVLTVSGPGGAGQTGFVGVEPLDNPIGIQGQLGAFALAIFTSGTRAWHAFDGTITSPEFVAFGGLELGLDSISVVLYDTADDDSWLNHSAAPLAVGTKTFNSPSTLVSVSVPASITISDVVHLSATFTFARGGTMNVDVATGWAGTPPVALSAALAGLPVLASDTGVFGRSTDWSTIYNLPVTSFQIAATNLNVFFGDGFDWTDANADDVIDDDELGSTSKGFLLSGGDIGFLLLSGGKTGVAAFDAAVKPRFYALSGAIDSLGLVNIGEFALRALDLGLEVNQGSQWNASAPVGSPAPVIDWVKSFGAAGFSLIVPGDDPVFDFAGTPVIGFSADRTLLTISDAVHISGSFSFRAGPVEYVDIATGLTSAPSFNPTLASALQLIPSSVGDPGGQTLGRSSDYSMLYNVPVRTIQIGASGVSVFLGWAPGISGWDFVNDADGILSRSEFNALTGDDSSTPVYDGDAIGFLVENLSLGMLVMNPTPFVAPHVGLDLLLPRLFALNSLAASASWVGFEEHFELQARAIAVEVNQGTPWALAPLGTPKPAVDWVASFPDTDGAATGDADGYEVRTGTTTAPVVSAFEGTPLIGVSADKVLLQISDAVLVTGSFSIRIGPVRLVDVATGLRVVDSVGRAACAAERDSAGGGGRGCGHGHVAVGGLLDDPQPAREHARVRGVRGVGVPGLGPRPGCVHARRDRGRRRRARRSEFNALTGDDATTPVYDGDAIGFLIENLALGMLVMNPVPLTGASAATLNPLLPKLFALNSLAASASWVGFEEHFELQARGDRGRGQPGHAVGRRAPRDTESRGRLGRVVPRHRRSGTWDAGGYEVRTGTTTAPVLLAFEGTPLIGVSADKVLLQISDAVLVTGSFSFRVGPVRLVDVATGVVVDPVGRSARAAEH